MRLRVVSDTHVDFNRFPELPNGDVLALVGDAGEARSPLTRQFLQRMGEQFNHVLYLMGNHEHYGGKFQDTADKLRAILPPNVRLLEKEWVILDGVRFVGTTLWTDFHRADPLSYLACQAGINDYRAITFRESPTLYRKLRTKDTYTEHQRSIRWLAGIYDEHRATTPDLKFVVLTHMGPTHKSVHPGYVNARDINGAYHSDLSEFILGRKIDLWAHGHIHWPLDYMVGGTRIVCNARGYIDYGEHVPFNPEFEVDL